MTTLILIPARMASTRLQGKPLADIAGRPMIVHVAERAVASGLGRVVVRLQPAGPSMFRTYELSREYAILETLSARGQPNVPKPRAASGPGWKGAREDTGDPKL